MWMHPWILNAVPGSVRRLGLWLMLLATCVSPAWAADVSDRVAVAKSALVFNRATNTFDSTVTLRNTSSENVSTPIALEVTSISQDSVTLVNASGTNSNGRPFVSMSGNLVPGAQASTVLKFSNPQRVSFTITTRVFGELPFVNALPEVVASPTQFFTATPTQVRFQSQVPPSAQLDKNSVRLFAADATGRPTGSALCNLLDNGGLGNGDDIAADNVYSCFATFSSPTATSIRLVVAATFATIAVPSPVIVLNIVAPLSEAAAQQVVDTQASASTLTKNLIASLGDNLAARQQAVSAILALPGVAAAGVASDNTTIWIRYTSGVDGGLMLNPPGTRGGPATAPAVRVGRPPPAMSMAPASFPRFRPLLPNGRSAHAPLSAAAAQSFVGNTNVLIWDAYNSDFSPFDEGPDLQALFSNSQCPLYSVTYLKDAQATVASVRNFTAYGTIVMVTHGAVDGNGQVVFLTRESASLLSILANAIDLVLGRIMVMGDVFAIRPSFIANLGGSFPGSVVYNGSCESAANATMADAFAGKGAKTYYGYTRIVNSDFAQSSANQLFAGLVTSLKTTGDAFTSVSPKVDPTRPNATFTQGGSVDLAYSGDLQNGNFESGNLASWTSSGDGRVLTGLGPFLPTEGNYAGLVSTGLGFTTASGSISQNFCMPKTATRLRFDWNFSSEEFIEWCNTQFDDSFEVVIDTGAGTNNVFRRSINGLCTGVLGPTTLTFDHGANCQVSSSQDCTVWSTGWQSADIDISGIAIANDGKGVTLRFRTSDVGDSLFDSAILVDKVTIVRP